MDARPVRSERNPASPSESFLRGRAVGPGPDGKGLMVDVAGELLNTPGDPSTPTGTPLVLARGSDGTWSPVTSPSSLPEALKQEILSMLAAANALDAKGLDDLRAQLGGKSAGLLDALELWRQSALKDPKQSDNTSAFQRPLLLQTDSLKNTPQQEGLLFLEITSGAGPDYTARLGGQNVRLQGPPGLSGNQGLWKLWPQDGNQWLTPAAAPPETDAYPLPARVPLTPEGIRSALQRLVPEALEASQPELCLEVESLAKELCEHLSATHDGDHIAPGTVREIETRQLLMALDAWSRPGEILLASPEAASRTLQQPPLDAAGLQRLAQQLQDAPQSPTAVHAWIKQNLSKLSQHALFPLGRGTGAPEDELALSLAKDLSRFLSDDALKPELRELAGSLVAMDLRAQQDPQGHVTLPWIQPQAGQWNEGTLRVVDRRKSRQGDGQARHCVEITLQPPALGHVDARLELQDKHLVVKLQAKEGSTSDLLRQHLPELEDRLKALQLIPSTSVQTLQPSSAVIPAANPRRLDLKA